MVAPDVLDAVVRGQPLIDERVVRAQKIHHAAVLVEDAVDEQLHLAAERHSERAIEGRISVRVGLQRIHIANLEPLEREVGRQRLGALVGQHAADLLLQHLGIAQLALFGHGEQVSSGMLLHRKNDRREASSVPLRR